MNLPPLPPEVDSVWCMIRGERDLSEPLDYYYTADQMREYARAAIAASRDAIIAEFLERTGQYVTNDASREEAIRAAIAAAKEQS